MGSGRTPMEARDQSSRAVSRRATASAPAQKGLFVVALFGFLAAAAIGYLTARNPHALPAHAAVVARVLIIVTLFGGGIYARTSALQARMGALLIGAGVFSSLWLLNGSSDPFAFTVGRVFAGLAPAVFPFVLLAHPTGRLRSAHERRFLLIGGGVLMLCSTGLVLLAEQPAVTTSLVRCAPHCPKDVLFIGSAPTLVPLLKIGGVMSWGALTCGTAVMLFGRTRAASPALRHSLTPVSAAAIATAISWLVFIIAEVAGASVGSALGAFNAEIVAIIPVAILLGLGLERLFMAGALEGFVNELARASQANPEAMMAEALADPSLCIAYQRPVHGTFVDASGVATTLPVDDPDRAVALIERDSRLIAAVVYDAGLADQARFVHAAGAVAVLQIQAAQLEADLQATHRELTASRTRLVDAADTERRRIERDLHDGVQQDLVGLRIKLGLAVDMLKAQPADGEQLITTIGEQLEQLVNTVRSLAGGVYPSVLTDHGLADALRSAALRSTIPLVVHADNVGRLGDDVERAVYFCCLEAIQNVLKHAGADVSATVSLRRHAASLHFEVADCGSGFSADTVDAGHGLRNMRERIDAVGGTLDVVSTPGAGTTVRGTVPVHARDTDGAHARDRTSARG